MPIHFIQLIYLIIKVYLKYNTSMKKAVTKVLVGGRGLNMIDQ